MAIPDFQSVMRPLLTSVQNDAPLSLNELIEWMIGSPTHVQRLEHVADES